MNYIRIAVHNKKENISAIFDSNEYFENIFKAMNFFENKNFDIIAISTEQTFEDGNIPKITNEKTKLILRTSSNNEITKINNIIKLDNKEYLLKGI